jgi:hypothetical protein
MKITFTIDPSWLAHPTPLATLLDHCRALEQPAPWTPPGPARQPGDDTEDLGQLLDGMADEPINPPANATAAVASTPPRASAPARPPAAGDVPTTGKQLYRWACDRKMLPDVNRIGKSLRCDKLVSNWTEAQVARAFSILTDPAPSANGRH